VSASPVLAFSDRCMSIPTCNRDCVLFYRSRKALAKHRDNNAAGKAPRDRYVPFAFLGSASGVQSGVTDEVVDSDFPDRFPRKHLGQ
jgi:hypothetical protein